MQNSWQGYITALGTQKAPKSSIDTGAYSNTEGGAPTGFVEWKPKNENIQKRYDAMNRSWEGIKASEDAANTIFKHEFAPVPNSYTN